MTDYLFEGIYVIYHHSLVFPHSLTTTVFLGRREYSCSLPTRLQGFDNATTHAVQRPDRVSESECCRAMHLEFDDKQDA